MEGNDESIEGDGEEGQGEVGAEQLFFYTAPLGAVKITTRFRSKSTS